MGKVGSLSRGIPNWQQVRPSFLWSFLGPHCESLLEKEASPEQVNQVVFHKHSGCLVPAFPEAGCTSPLPFYPPNQLIHALVQTSLIWIFSLAQKVLINTETNLIIPQKMNPDQMYLQLRHLGLWLVCWRYMLHTHKNKVHLSSVFSLSLLRFCCLTEEASCWFF